MNTVQNTANIRLHTLPQIINLRQSTNSLLSFAFLSNTPHHYHSNALRKEEVKKKRSFSDALILIISSSSSHSHHPQ